MYIFEYLGVFLSLLKVFFGGGGVFGHSKVWLIISKTLKRLDIISNMNILSLKILKNDKLKKNTKMLQPKLGNKCDMCHLDTQ